MTPCEHLRHERGDRWCAPTTECAIDSEAEDCDECENYEPGYGKEDDCE